MTFPSVPIDPPGSGQTLILRITGIRVNVGALGVAPGSTGEVVADVAVAGSVSINVNNSAATVGYIAAGLDFQLRTPDDSAASSGFSFASRGSANGYRFATLRFQKLLPAFPFKTRTLASFVDSNTSPTPVVQNVPGFLYATESGFYNPALTGPSGSLATAGLADFGTRIEATFSDIPAGVSLWVSTLPATFTNGIPAANTTGSVARLIGSDTAAFSPVTPIATLDGMAVAPLQLVNGSGTAVWEVLSVNQTQAENFDFPVWITYSGVAGGTASVTGSYGPTSGIQSTPIPRFVS